MSLNGLCFVTFDGKKVVGRPSNSFKQALEKSQKSFFGQLRVNRDLKNSNYGVEVLRNGKPILETSNANHIKFNLTNNVLEIKFFGNKVPKIIEFADKNVFTGFQVDKKHFLTITVHMHFIKYLEYGNLSNEEQKIYHDMIQKLEKIVHEKQEARNIAIAKVLCKKELLEEISDTSNLQNIQNYGATYFGTKAPTTENLYIPSYQQKVEDYADFDFEEKQILQQQTVDVKPSFTPFEGRCESCSEKEAMIASLKEELEKEKRNVEELKEKLEKGEKLNKDALENVATLNEMIQKRNVKINTQNRDYEQLQMRYSTLNEENHELRQAQRIEELEQTTEEFERPEILVQPHELQYVYIPRTGECHHSHPGCSYIRNSKDVRKVLLLHVQGSKRPCSRC